ncbi:MAG: HAMP domain-containing histidine kinase [Roseburia sp.]|nr:HAMP domain-containing histidine kinase [Roseburia sp.]
MKQSLRTRLIFISAGMILLCIVVCWIMNLVLLPGFYENSKKKQMNGVYSQVAELFEKNDWETISSEQQNEVYDSMDKISANSGVSLYIMEIKVNVESGMVSEISYVYPSMSGRTQELNRNQLSKYVLFKQLGNVFDENYQLLKKTDQYELFKVYDERMDSNYIELVGGVKGDYWVYVRSNYQSIRESAAISNEFLIYVGIVVIILCVLIMIFVSNRYTKPILALARLARKMEELNFNVRYEENRKDEIGVLGHSMNSLSDKLQETISELKTANNELQLDLQRRSEQEKMRQEFLANVSHELKTPIALIQGYAEGLQENVNDDPESRDFYCEVIVDEADKMNKMVKKLLSLNQLEFGNGQVHLEHFDVQEIVKSVIASSDILFKQKEITLSFAEREPVYVWADEYMTEEVVMNYVSNAVNHIGGDRMIEIRLRSMEGRVRISVFNTGEQIPEEELDKIWDKFYKVDKARTREYGGNGIGLSIVKAIMEAHNQAYGVRNYDNGVEFWFELDEKAEN